MKDADEGASFPHQMALEGRDFSELNSVYKMGRS